MQWIYGIFAVLLFLKACHMFIYDHNKNISIEINIAIVKHNQNIALWLLTLAIILLVRIGF